MRAVILHTT